MRKHKCDVDVLLLRKLYAKNNGNLIMSAADAEMDRKTAAKYLNGALPSEIKKTRKAREGKSTRESPFKEGHELELKKIYENDRKIQPITLLGYLLETYPSQGYTTSILRTLQRRVQTWSKEHESFREAQFAQVWHPGKTAQLDWTHMNELQVTIEGIFLEHRLCHLIFPHSNWSWGTLCFSESLLSLKLGFQQACWRAGGLPHVLQTDNSSSATHELSRADKKNRCKEDEEGSASRKRGFNKKYLEFAQALGIKVESIPVGCCNANADIETRNGHLKNSIDQQLILRGSRDFNSRDEYQEFLDMCFEKFNDRTVGERFKTDELPLLQNLPPEMLPVYNQESVKVSKESIIKVNKNFYSVPNLLVGELLDLEIYEDRILVFQKGKAELFSIDKLHGEGKALINFRHLIAPLQRKLGAFRNYRYHASFFPGSQFRRCYDRLCSRKDQRQADRCYLEILALAIDHDVVTIDACLQDILGEGILPNLEELKKRLDIPAYKYEEREFKADMSDYACFDSSEGEQKS